MAVEGEDKSACGVDGDAGTRESKRVPHRLGLVSTNFFGMTVLSSVDVDGGGRWESEEIF